MLIKELELLSSCTCRIKLASPAYNNAVPQLFNYRPQQTKEYILASINVKRGPRGAGDATRREVFPFLVTKRGASTGEEEEENQGQECRRHVCVKNGLMWQTRNRTALELNF